MTNNTELAQPGLSALEGKLNQIISLAPGVVFQFQIDADNNLSVPYASPRLLSCSELPDTAIYPRSAEDILNMVHSDDLERVKDSIAISRQKLLPWQCDFRVHHEGRLKWIRGSANQQQMEGNTTLWHGIMIDITDLKAAQIKLEESERMLRDAQQLASIGHWYSKLDADEIFWSDVVFEIFGLAPEHTCPTVELFNRHVHPEDFTQLRECQARARETGTLDLEHRIIRPDGTIGWVHLIGQVNHISETFHGTIQDITERKLAERELHELATTDPLTKLYNRRFFTERSESVMKFCERLGKPVAVVMFDLDRFKVVNDTYGHATGDIVLQKIASEVKALLRTEDVLGRIGGEEFAITLPDTSLLLGVKVAEKLRLRIQELEFTTSNAQETFQLTCSFGVTERKNDESLDQLLAHADKALYSAKHTGRNKVETKV